MKSDKKHSTIQGLYPTYGAIFVSSSSTKDECFRRRLFGSPCAQGSFVKKVKSGMLLFLFEFDKRVLHGVFQARSDGEMNIVPTAWSRSGKKFPAQVRVDPIWRCYPLPESEFGDAIKENYFSKSKFNLGLSKSQVWRLLMLFSLQKVKSVHPQRSLARYIAAKPVDTKDIAGELDDGRVTSGNLHEVDNKRSRCIEHLPGRVEQDDAKFGIGVNVEKRISVFSRLGENNSSHQMELPVTDQSYEASRGDAVIPILPYDAHDPGLNLPHSQLVGGDANLDSIQDCDGIEGVSLVDVHGSLSAISFTPLPGAAPSAEMAIYSPKSILAPESLSEFGSNGRDGPSSYPLSPSNYPSFLFDHGDPVAVQNKVVPEIAPCAANVASSEEIQCQSPCRSHSADLERTDYHEHECSDDRTSGRMLYSDVLENRTSVFSRLRFNTPACCQQNLGHKENVNRTSVDEDTAMLSGSHQKGLGNDEKEALEFVGNDASDNTLRDREIYNELRELFGLMDSVKSVDEESMQVVGTGTIVVGEPEE